MKTYYITAVQINKEYVIKGNEEINKYLGVEISHKKYAPTIVATNGSYHKSWDWLMNVVEKINEEQQVDDELRDLNYTISNLLSSGFLYHDHPTMTFTLENLWYKVVDYCAYKNNLKNK